MDPTDATFDTEGKDCRGICPTSVLDHHFLDTCGQCLLVTDPQWNDCPELETGIDGNETIEEVEEEIAEIETEIAELEAGDDTTVVQDTDTDTDTDTDDEVVIVDDG